MGENVLNKGHKTTKKEGASSGRGKDSSFKLWIERVT